MTNDDIEKMNYTDFIAFIQETNRCPGGKDTIMKIKNLLSVDKDFNILDVGSNTGFNSLELAHITRSRIYGIDISNKCVLESKRKLAEDTADVQTRVSFQTGSAYDIPFKNETFDLVLAGGATAFMSDKKKAISEYKRVVKPWGYICITPLFYHSKPPKILIHKVSELIGSDIKVMSLEDWINIFLDDNPSLELYYVQKNKIKNRSVKEVNHYIEYFLKKPHIDLLSDSIKVTIMRKWKSYIQIFNENHKYLSYGIVLFRKTVYTEELELFKADK